jgi:hypothetical protein
MIGRKPKPEIMLKLLGFGHMYIADERYQGLEVKMDQVEELGE